MQTWQVFLRHSFWQWLWISPNWSLSKVEKTVEGSVLGPLSRIIGAGGLNQKRDFKCYHLESQLRR